MGPIRLGVLVALCVLLAASSAQAGTRVVVLPVVVHSAAADPSYVSQGIADMLSARLEQQGTLEVVKLEDASLATTRLARALEAGRDQRGEFVIFGSFTQFGDGASLDLQCAPLDGNGTSRSIFIQSGAMAEIIPKLDELADKLTHYVSGRAPARPTPGVAAGAPGVGAAEAAELRRRLEALERAVFAPEAEAGEAPGPESDS